MRSDVWRRFTFLCEQQQDIRYHRTTKDSRSGGRGGTRASHATLSSLCSFWRVVLGSRSIRYKKARVHSKMYSRLSCQLKKTLNHVHLKVAWSYSSSDEIMCL
jgi:hypothetical protein